MGSLDEAQRNPGLYRREQRAVNSEQ